LEMRTEPLLHMPLPGRLKLMLLRAENPSESFYRFLRASISNPITPTEDDNQLTSLTLAPNSELWVLYAHGCPAGFFETNTLSAEDTKLAYFGIAPEFQGQSLASWLLAEAIRACWAKKPVRVIVQTTSLDDPKRLSLYQQMGFSVYAQETLPLT
jgi:GNAT superfamily N-acetyltransferase